MNSFPEFDTIIMDANLFSKSKEKTESVPVNEMGISFSSSAKFKIMPEKFLEGNQAVFLKENMIVAEIKNGKLYFLPKGKIKLFHRKKLGWEKFIKKKF